MRRILLLPFLCFATGVGACRATADGEAGAVVEARPEVRYYVIADT